MLYHGHSKTVFELHYISRSIALRGNDRVKGLITASNDGLYFIIIYLLVYFCARNRPEFHDYLSRLLKTSARNACIFCATDKARLGLATAFLALPHTRTITQSCLYLYYQTLSNPVMAIKAVRSELLCIPNSTSMASSTKRARMGKFCVCRGSGLRSCTNTAGIRNTYHVEGISMHKFPANEEQQKICIKFVRKHRPNFTPTNSSVIYSPYFETSCFEFRLKNFRKNAVDICFS